MNNKIEPQTTNQEEQSQDGQMDLPSWEEYSANGGTFFEYLNSKMRRAGLFEFATSETQSSEQPSLTEKRTMRFAAHSQPRSCTSEHPEDGSTKVSGKQSSKLSNELPS